MIEEKKDIMQNENIKEFNYEQNKSNERILEAIQMNWIEEID